MTRVHNRGLDSSVALNIEGKALPNLVRDEITIDTQDNHKVDDFSSKFKICKEDPK